MNKRFNQLAEQADKFADDTLQMVGELHPNWHDVRDQKFAELIVQDCVDFIDCGESGDPYLAKAMKEYFGMK